MTLPEAVEAEFQERKGAIEALTRHPIQLQSPEEGRYRVICEGEEVARFRLRRSLQCSGIAVPYGVVTAVPYRGRGIGQLLETLRLAAAKRAGFGLALMTTRDDNELQNHIVIKHGWKTVARFYNPLTQHRVRVWIFPLSEPTSEESC